MTGALRRVLGAKAFFFGLTLLLGCSQRTDEGFGELANLCRELGGGAVHRIAEPVDGYVDETDFACGSLCAGNLAASKYKYIEAYSPQADHKHYVPSVGTFRFQLSKPSDPQCELFEQQIAAKRRPKEFNGSCVATLPIDQLSLRYSFSLSRRPYREGSDFVIARHHQIIRDRITKEVLAEYSSFSLYRKGGSSRVFTCLDVDNAYDYKPFSMYDVLPKAGL